MRALVLVHRWLGVACCVLFAMWFASGIIMHFVPFPDLTEGERIGGLAPLDTARARYGPGEAVIASGLRDATRARMLSRIDGLVYIVQGASATRAVSATNLSPALVQSPRVALAIAVEHARRRGMDAALAALAELADYDQWTVPNGLDAHRPLYRIALNDDPATELYVSSATGEVVRDTTRRERWWNFAGSVVHWIYPTVLRRDWRAWDAVVWALSLVAFVGAISGALLGPLRLIVAQGHIGSPYQGWQAWHHWLGLGCMTFLLTWIFSGWLSMDHGRLFSTGKPSPAEAAAFAGAASLENLPAQELRLVREDVLEVEWFALDGRIYRRERVGVSAQRLSPAGESASPGREFLQAFEATTAMRLAPGCAPAAVAHATDHYPIASRMPGAPVYRSVCGDTWFHVDGANGALLEKLDPSRRVYRWAYGALHTLDFPALAARPSLRTSVIVLLCGLGLAFSLTAVVIGWRRLRQSISVP